jgi:6-phosphogluconolactonase
MTEIVVRRDAGEVAAEASERFVRLADEAVRQRGQFSVALSGGSTPKALYGLLSSAPFRDRVDWSKVLLFFGDERNVTPDADDSNYRMAREALFDPLGRETDLKVFRWKTETGIPSEVASNYEKEIVGALGPTPAFDLVLLGLGPDAHTASLFPHSPALTETGRLAVENWVEKFDAYRLTLTFPVINAARTVMFLVAGKDKAAAVITVLSENGDPTEFPARSVRPNTGELVWVLDKAAADGLSR